jgi:hypothetical protein
MGAFEPPTVSLPVGVKAVRVGLEALGGHVVRGPWRRPHLRPSCSRPARRRPRSRGSARRPARRATRCTRAGPDDDPDPSDDAPALARLDRARRRSCSRSPPLTGSIPTRNATEPRPRRQGSTKDFSMNSFAGTGQQIVRIQPTGARASFGRSVQPAAEIAEPAHCRVSGKRRWPSREAARAALELAIERGDIKPQNHSQVAYKCPDCRGWHLTRAGERS